MNKPLSFLDIQKDSFKQFIFGTEEEEENLKSVLKYCLNFTSQDDRFIFRMINYSVKYKNISKEEEINIQRNSETYKLSINAELEIEDKKYDDIYKKEVLLCEIPCITEKGEFLINGVYRIIVPHLLRTKGVFFNINNITKEHMARIRPMYGKNIEFSIKVKGDDKSVICKIENHKFNWATILISFFFEDLKDLFDFMFYKEEIEFDFSLDKTEFVEKYSDLKIIDFSYLDTENNFDMLLSANRKSISYIYDKKNIKKAMFYIIDEEYKIILNDINLSLFDNLSCSNYLYSKMRNSVILGQSKEYVTKTFFNNDFYSLGEIGRYIINRKFNTDFKSFVLNRTDSKNIIFHLISIYNNKPGFFIDEQYDLENLYIQKIGQYLANDIRSIGLSLKRNLIDKCKILSRKENRKDIKQEITNSKFINLSKIGTNTRIQKFFLLHPSSQFLSQLNPLSSIMHKMKINTMDDSIHSSSDFASFESRNLQKSFYGRICCITTPDSKMVGLVNFSTINCNLDKNGFLQSPYNKVENGVIKDEIIYLNAYDESRGNYYIADFSSRENNKINKELVRCRHNGEIKLVRREKINLVDVHRNQIVSLSSYLIPFLEHNDNTRASMGSNMMKQIIPCIKNEKPMINTGLEALVIEKDNNLIFAEDKGEITYADSNKIEVKYKDQTKTYKIFPYIRTNQNTLSYTKTKTKKGEIVDKNSVLNESYASCDNKLSLGKNLLTAVLPYEGLNFEDAIVVSDKCVKSKLFDSYVLNEYITSIERTKFGYEKITNNIPQIEDELYDLDKEGIIKIGSIVKKGDIIIGKLTPELTEFTNKIDERIMDIVFGQKALNYKDTSIRYQGDIGEVIDVIKIKNNSKVSVGKKPETIKVIIGERKSIKIGDKICGRYGNKNIISKVIPECDMPYLKDGRIVEAVINPLGIVSRMNIGQLLEMNLTLAMKELNIPEISIKPYERDNLSFIKEMLKKSGYPEDGKIEIFDGKTDEMYKNRVTVGYMYTMPMEHKVDNKFNARSIGTYSTVTEQPLAGRGNRGGQKTGQMELWCLEAFGAKSTILEKTSVLSDDTKNKKKLLKNLVFGGHKFKFGKTSTFNLFIQLLKSLCYKSKLDIKKETEENNTNNE